MSDEQKKTFNFVLSCVLYVAGMMLVAKLLIMLGCEPSGRTHYDEETGDLETWGP